MEEREREGFRRNGVRRAWGADVAIVLVTLALILAVESGCMGVLVGFEYIVGWGGCVW